MKFRLAVAATASFALAACGSADDASTEAEADTVEIPANEALEGVDAEPVADDAAAIEAEANAEASAAAVAAEAERIEEAGDNAADTAGAVFDALEESETE